MNQLAVFYAATPRLLRTLLAAMAGLYVLFLIAALAASVAPGAAGLAQVFEWLALSPQAVASRPWSLVTHPFVNPVLGFFGALSLFFGLSFLHLLGRDATELLGERWFGITCLVATLGASLLAVVAGVALGYGGRVFGPWPLVMGLAMALGIRFPEKTVGLFLIGAVRLVVLVPVFLVLSILLNASFFAALPELGAALAGASWAYASRGGLRRAPRAAAPLRPGQARPRAQPEATPRGRATSGEVDRILDKISAQGYASLTPEEKRVLEEASRRG